MLGEAYECLALVFCMGLRDWRLAEAHLTAAKLYVVMNCKRRRRKTPIWFGGLSWDDGYTCLTLVSQVSVAGMVLEGAMNCSPQKKKNK